MNTNRGKRQGARGWITLFGLLMLFLMVPGLAQAGKVLPEDLQITTNSDDQTSPAVAYDTVTNKYLVVWTDYRNSNTNGTDIYGKICTGTGSGSSTGMTCGSEFVISNAAGNQAQPRAAFSYYTGNYKYLVVWTDSRSGAYGQIYGQFVAPDGTLYGGNFAISTYTAGQDINQYDPDVIFNPVANKFVTAWVDTSTFDTPANPLNAYTITGFNSTGTCTTSYTYTYIPVPTVDHNIIRTADVNVGTGAVTNKQEISKLVSTSPWAHTSGSVSTSWSVFKSESKPRLSYNAMTGETMVAFSGRSYTVTLNATYTTKDNYTTATPPVYINTTCQYSPPAFASTDNDAGLVKIKVRRNTGLGLLLDLSFGTGNSISPAVTMDPNTNRMLVAWEDAFSINGQLIDMDSFLPYGTAISISAGTGARTSPVAGFDNVNQRFFVAWEDARNQSANISNVDIYGQFIDPQGNLSGANSLVSMAVDNQLAPAMAFGDMDFRDFLVVWKDARSPGNSDIYGQLFEFSEMPQLLIEDAAGNPVLNGAIDFGYVTTGQIKDVGFKLCNNGNTQLTINSMTAPSEPFSSLIPPPVTVSPKICYDMTVRFAPTAAGSYSGNASNNFKTTIDSTGGKVIIYFSGAGSGVSPLNITATSLPDGSASSAYTASLTGYGGVFPYTWGISSGSLPPGLSLNASTGAISGSITSGTSGTYNFTVTVTDSNSPIKATTSSSLSIKVTGMTVTTAGLKSWTMGVAYENAPVQYIAVTGGTAPYTCAKTSGTLPNGITVNSACSVTGIPNESGAFVFAVTATDSSGATATKDLSITINPLPVILTSSLPAGIIGTLYSQTLLSTGGTLPVKWSISKGSTTTGALPPGLSFSSGSGVISGTPTAPGSYSFDAQATDAAGQPSAAMPLSITIATAGGSTTSIYPATIDFGTIKVGATSASQTVTVSNGGAGSFTINSVARPGAPFRVVSNACTGKTLTTGASCSISIVFNPTFAGKVSRNITVSTTDTANPTLISSLSGTGGSQ